MVVNHEAKLVDNITNLMSCDSINDVWIRLSNGVQIEANKVILSAMSTFFHKQIHKKNEEQKSTSDGKFLEIVIDISSTKEMLELVKKYLYTGKMDFDSLGLKDLIDLIHLLISLELHEVAQEVTPFTLKNINEGGFSLEKILILSGTAEAYGLNNVVSSMLNYLDENISDVSKLPEVQYISSDFLLLLLADKTVKKDDVNEKFFSRFVTLTSWLASTNEEVDLMLKTKCISMFDLKRFTNQQLTSTVRKSRLFSESSILDVLSHSVTNLEVKVDDFQEKVNSLEEKVSDLEENESNLQEEVKELEERVETLAKEVDELKGSKRTIIQNFQNTNKTLNEERRNVETLKRKNVQLESENKKYVRRLTSYGISPS